MGAIVPAILALVFMFASAPAAAAAEKKLVSPALSINPNEGQPLCLVSNLSATATVAVTVEIADGTGTGTVAIATPLTRAPGAIDGTTDVLTNFYSYCRMTPEEAKHLSLIRGSHCIASGNTARTGVEAEKK